MAVQLLLKEDVLDLGKKGEIVSVRNGYARNFLLPRGIAMKADANALRRQNALLEERRKQAVVDLKESQELAAQLEGKVIVAIVKVDPEKRMYGSVAQNDIIDLLKEQHQLETDKRFIQLKHPIKVIGSHKIELRLKEGVVAVVTLKILPESGKDHATAIAEAMEEEAPAAPEATDEASN